MSGFYWLASYPKSGNTWLRLFLESLAAGGKAVDINSPSVCGSNAASRAAFDWILDIESTDLTNDEILQARPRQYEIEVRQAEEPLLCKVHDAWCFTPAGEPLFPPELTLGVIYIVRDPRDVAVSLAHHMNQTVDQSITHMANPKAVMGVTRRRMPLQLPQQLYSWSRHVASWLHAPVKRLLLNYEDMLTEPTKRFGEVARFLGFNATHEMVGAAVDAVRFDRLQQAEKAKDFIERQPGTICFFRRGIAGGWRDSLTPSQVARIEADHGFMMRSLGYL